MVQPGQKFYISIAFILLVAYAGILSYLLLFKFQFGSIGYRANYLTEGISLKQSLQRANFIPLKGIWHVLNAQQRTSFILQNIVGNIVGFMPLGILLPVAFVFTKSFRVIAFVGCGTSLFFEAIQLLASRGTFDVDDILLNTLGTILGYSIFLFFHKRLDSLALSGTPVKN